MKYDPNKQSARAEVAKLAALYAPALTDEERRAHNFVPRIAKQYAARHGYQVSIETQDEPDAVRADLGTLYRVVRL